CPFRQRSRFHQNGHLSSASVAQRYLPSQRSPRLLSGERRKRDSHQVPGHGGYEHRHQTYKIEYLIRCPWNADRLNVIQYKLCDLSGVQGKPKPISKSTASPLKKLRRLSRIHCRRTIRTRSTQIASSLLGIRSCEDFFTPFMPRFKRM